MATLQDALKQAYANPPMGHVPPAATGAVDPNMALEPKGVKPVNPLKLTPGTTGIPESPEWTTSKGFAAAGPNTGPQVAMGSPNAGPQVGMGAPNQGPQVGMGSPNQGPHMSHMGGPNVGPQSGMGPNAGPQAPTMEGVRNPNVAKGAFSAEGAQFAQSQAPQAGGGGGRPGVIDMASGGGSGKGAAFDAGNKVGEFFRNPVVKGAGKVLAVADAAGQAGDALDNFAQGNNVMGGYHAGRAGVATAAGMGNPLAIAASTGLFVGDRIYNNISDNMQNTIGSGANSLVRGTGKIFGQDWGVDPQQAAGGSGQPSAAGKPGSAVIPTSPDGGIPLGPQNSLRALENRIPMLRNGEVAKGDRKTVPLPPNYEPGAEKVDGVYGKDIGGGIKKFDRPGQSPLYTNMEGPGAGFENRREVTPQNAAAMNALAGRYENQQRQAAQAQLAREQAGPGPQVSIMNSGMRGNMRINDNGDKGQSIADMVKTLKSNGIKVSHNTLRTMLANQGQREAAQIQANASMYGHDSSSRTQLATNANTVNAQREGNQLQNQASMHGHNVSASGNRIRQAFEQKKFGIEQGWKQVDHNRAVGNDTRQAREHGEKMFNESVGRMFPGQEGAADAAAFTKAAHHTIANHVNNLRKSGSPEAMAKAQEIEANPWSSEMMSRLAQGYQVRKTSAANHGNWGTPGSGKHVESDDLFSYTTDPTRKTDEGMFDNETPLRNGGTISENAASGTSAIKNAFGYGQRTQDQINYINQR